jgi:MarR family transcriptional regulator for hemolysin
VCDPPANRRSLIYPEFRSDFNRSLPATPSVFGDVVPWFYHAYHKHAYYFGNRVNSWNDADRSVGFLISDLARLLRRSFDRRVQALGLTQVQWRAILNLSRAEGMTQSALAEALEVKPITLARLIDRMEVAGWVERRNHPLDRRAVQLYLTAKSAPLLAEIQTRARTLIDEATAGLSTTDERALVSTLQHIKRNLTANQDAAASALSSARTQEEHVGRQTPKQQRHR